MKKYTLLIAVAFLGSSLSSFGQNPDIGMSALDNFYTGMTIYPNIPMNVQYQITNYGTTTVLPSIADSMIRYISVDGTMRTSNGFNLGTSGLAAGATTPNFTTSDQLDFGSYGLTAGNVAVCGSTKIWKNGANIDVNSSNDETCVTVVYTTTPFTYDVAPSNLQFSSPAYAPGASLPIPTFPSEMTFDLSNEGSTDLPIGLGVSFDMTIAGGAPVTYTGALNTSISAPGSATLTINFSGSLPITAGPFDVCIEMTMADDVNASNDKTCSNYIMGGNSIEETEKSFGDIFYNSGLLRLEFNNSASGIANVALFETSGRNVGNFELNVDKTAKHTVDLNQFGTGVYIANITVNGEVISYRFINE